MYSRSIAPRKYDYNYYCEVYLGRLAQLGKIPVGKFSINREAPSLIYTHTLTLVLHKREKEGETEKEED